MVDIVIINLGLEFKFLSCSWCIFEWFEREMNSWLNGCLNKEKVFFSFFCLY